MTPLRVAVFGFGYWGRNLARVFSEAPGAVLAGIVDEDEGARVSAARRHHVPTFDLDGAGLVLRAGDVDAVVIATPAATHLAIVRACLEAGKHVLVTKPLAPTAADVLELAAQADRAGRVLMVDHTFVYTDAVRWLADAYRSGLLGRALHIDSSRVNLGQHRTDTGVLEDLATHDLSILIHVLDEEPEYVRAVAVDRTGCGQPDVAYLTCWWPDGLVAQVHVSWLSPVKVRRMLFAGSRRMVVYDDVQADEKIRVYDSGAEVVDSRVAYRAGQVTIPRLDGVEALARLADHFTAVCAGRLAPGRHLLHPLWVARVLDAARLSVGRGGALVPVGTRPELVAQRRAVDHWEDADGEPAGRVAAVSREILAGMEADPEWGKRGNPQERNHRR